jgi:hypothetical protein
MILTTDGSTEVIDFQRKRRKKSENVALCRIKKGAGREGREGREIRITIRFMIMIWMNQRKWLISRVCWRKNSEDEDDYEEENDGGRSGEGLGLGVEIGLGFAEAVQEEVVVGHGFLDELLEQENFRGVDDGVDALLKGLHGGEGLKW